MDMNLHKDIQRLKIISLNFMLSTGLGPTETSAIPMKIYSPLLTSISLYFRYSICLFHFHYLNLKSWHFRNLSLLEQYSIVSLSFDAGLFAPLLCLLSCQNKYLPLFSKDKALLPLLEHKCQTFLRKITFRLCLLLIYWIGIGNIHNTYQMSPFVNIGFTVFILLLKNEAVLYHSLFSTKTLQRLTFQVSLLTKILLFTLVSSTILLTEIFL